MACNYCFPTGTTFQINSEFRKKGTFRCENRTSCLVGLKTRPTIYIVLPRSGIELTTSRLHSFLVAKESYALNHSAMETVHGSRRMLHQYLRRSCVGQNVNFVIVYWLLNRLIAAMTNANNLLLLGQVLRSVVGLRTWCCES